MSCGLSSWQQVGFALFMSVLLLVFFCLIKLSEPIPWVTALGGRTNLTGLLTGTTGTTSTTSKPQVLPTRRPSHTSTGSPSGTGTASSSVGGDAADLFALGAAGSTACPSGFSPVLDRVTCDAAAQALGKEASTYTAAVWMNTRINGCFNVGRTIFLNPYISSSASPEDVRVCKAQRQKVEDVLHSSAATSTSLPHHPPTSSSTPTQQKVEDVPHTSAATTTLPQHPPSSSSAPTQQKVEDASHSSTATANLPPHPHASNDRLPDRHRYDPYMQPVCSSGGTIFSAEPVTASDGQHVEEAGGAIQNRKQAWTLKTLNLCSLQGDVCPTDCSNATGSCGQCITTANWIQEMSQYDRLYKITNAFYDPLYVGPQLWGNQKDLTLLCGDLCRPIFNPYYHATSPMISQEGKKHPSMYPWYTDRLHFESQEYRWKKANLPDNFACDADAVITDPALVINWMAPTNLYHFTFDNVFSTFVTAGHIAKLHGCTAGNVRVYIKDGFPFDGRAPFGWVWALLFGGVLKTYDMAGCYKTVYYGQIVSTMQNIVPFSAADRIVIRDPGFSSWMHAFRSSLRADLQAWIATNPVSISNYAPTLQRTGCTGSGTAEVLSYWKTMAPDKVMQDMYSYCVATQAPGATRSQMDVCCGKGVVCRPEKCELQTKLRDAVNNRMLVVQHNRAPPWFNAVDWSVPGIEAVFTRLQDMSYDKQVVLVSKARGLVGVAGSGLSHLVFLPPHAFLGYVALGEPQVNGPDKCCWVLMGKDKNGKWIEAGESSSMCYASPAAHGGLQVVYWRWCKTDIWNADSAFTSSQAQSVLKLILPSDDAGEAGRSTGRLCLVLDHNTKSPGWPHCDEDISIPRQPLEESCSYPNIGRPVRWQSNDTFYIASPCEAPPVPGQKPLLDQLDLPCCGDG